MRGLEKTGIRDQLTTQWRDFENLIAQDSFTERHVPRVLIVHSSSARTAGMPSPPSLLIQNAWCGGTLVRFHCFTRPPRPNLGPKLLKFRANNKFGAHRRSVS